MRYPVNIAAYCRVSTDKEDQLNSLEAQKEFFSEYTSRTGDVLVRLYADEGISGTKRATGSRHSAKRCRKPVTDLRPGRIAFHGKVRGCRREKMRHTSLTVTTGLPWRWPLQPSPAATCRYAEPKPSPNHSPPFSRSSPSWEFIAENDSRFGGMDKIL